MGRPPTREKRGIAAPMVDPNRRRRSKESRRVSKTTGSTEAVQETTDREARASGIGRRAEENPLDNF